MRIVLINHTFQIPRFYKRWLLLAKENINYDITLIAPYEYKWDISDSMIFGSDIVLQADKVDLENFHIVPVKTKSIKLGGWISKEMVDTIIRLNPDMVYHIGAHTQPSLFQCLRLKRKLKDMKVLAFSMRGPTMDLHFPTMKRAGSIKGYMIRLLAYPIRRFSIKYFNKHVDAVLCHYPDALNCFRNEGYRGPIYISTQVGVDTDIYYPNEEDRNEIRKRYNLGDSYVFGTAARFIPDKGLFEIIEALPKEGNWKYLLMGKGNDDFTAELNRLIESRGLSNKVILTGYIDADNMPKYWNAVDCAIHIPRTTHHWQETFSLAIVQAMACGKPVIGNTSGSVPYQVGSEGIIIPEGDIYTLSEKLIWVLQNADKMIEIGNKGLQRAVNCFSIKHLNSHFLHILKEVQEDKYNLTKLDMTKFRNTFN